MSVAVYMACKSSVNVNHLHSHVQIYHIYTYPVAVYIYFLYLHKISINIFQIHLHAPLDVLGHVSVNTKIICKVTLPFGLLSPQTLLSGSP
jgi:hypothetical protein